MNAGARFVLHALKILDGLNGISVRSTRANVNRARAFSRETRAFSRVICIREGQLKEREKEREGRHFQREIYFSKFRAAGYNCRRDRTGRVRAGHLSRSLFFTQLFPLDGLSAFSLSYDEYRREY